MELALVGLLIVCLLPGSAASDEQPAIQMALIVESTVGTGRDGFYGERAMIAALLKELNDSDISATIINTGDSAVTHGNLTTLAAASKLTSELQFLDGEFFNLQDALEKTEALLSFADQTVVKIVVVVTAGDVRCPLRRETRGKNVCRVVDHLKRSGASFGTIALHYHDVPNPVITIAPECARMSSDGALPTDFRHFIQRNRCLFSADGNADSVCGALCAVTPSPHSEASETLKVGVDAQLPRLNVAVPPRSHPSTVALRGTRQCSSDLSKLWLDMVIIFDSTFGVGYEGFKGSIAMIDGIVSTMRIGAFDGHHTRLGVVNLGSTAEQIAGLDDLGSTEQASKAMGGMKYRGDFELNVEEGLLKAIEIFDSASSRPFAQKLVVLLTSHRVECPDAVGAASPCRAAAYLKSFSKLLTISMRYHDNTLPPLTSLASPCGYATTSDDLKLEELAAKTNCFCEGEGWTQFAADCELSAECVYLYEAQTGYLGAQEGCRLAHSDARLASIHNQEKSDFLAAIARNYSVSHNHEITKVWTGLRFQAREGFTWDDETPLDWWRGEHGGRNWSEDVCASMTIGGGNWWTPEMCAIDRPSLSYFCQRPACDASNFCSAVNSK